MRVWLFTLASVVGVSLASLIGLATLSLDQARLRRLATWMVSFAVGALLGDAFIHLIPEIFEKTTSPLRQSLWVLAGMLLFFVVEKLVRHRHGLTRPHRHEAAGTHRPELVAVNLIGDGIHNFIDGMLIAASYLVSPTLGISTTTAVLFHELPQELGDFGVLVHSGLSVRRATLFNLASAGTALLGAAVTLLLGAAAHEAVVSILVPFAAGGFVYIACADLIPELQHVRGLRGLTLQSALICVGIAVMALLKWME